VSIVSSYFGISYYGCFSFFLRRRRFGKKKSLMHLKLDLVAADTEDTMEFAVEEETAS
jgi:hypothetical protein